MNDQSQMMNQAKMMAMSQAQVMNASKMMSQAPVMNAPKMMSQPQIMGQMTQSSQPQMMSQSQAMVAQQQQSQLMMMTSQSQPPPMLNRNYKVWPKQQQQQLQLPPMDPNKFQKPNFLSQKQFKLGRNNTWKGKKSTDKRKDPRRIEKPMPNAPMGGQTSGGGYNPPTLNELQHQNRLKARKFYPNKKFNNRFAPYAPRNTTSYWIRAKKSGGIASLISPCPVTPAVLPTPIFSPSREVLGDMAKEEWGVDGYGSMKGLIRLRSPGNDDEDEEEGGGGGSSGSDVEEHVEVERRLDHDLSRFEMIYPNYSGVDYNNVLENRVDDQDSHIAQLEEENLTLKERLFLMEREMGDLRRRLQFLERQNQIGGEIHEEVVENESENESEEESDAQTMFMGGKNNEEEVEYVSENRGGRVVGDDAKEEQYDGYGVLKNKLRNDIVAHVMTSKESDIKNEETRKELLSNDERDKNGLVSDEMFTEKDEETKNKRVIDQERVGRDSSDDENEKNQVVDDKENAKMNEEMGD